MTRTVLGLDLGPNSIGWALVNDDPDDSSVSNLIDMGVRVFPEGVDQFDTAKERSPNETRRVARGMRRQVRRRRMRRKLLRGALVDVGLWPEDHDSQAKLLDANPYDLRRRALEERLELHEIGRVLLHINQRRGFLSNRKKDRGDKEVQGMLAEINSNEQERIDGGFATIGEYLASKLDAQDHTNRATNDHVRNRHLSREQLVAEFHAVWDAQAQFHPDVLTKELRFGVLGDHTGPRTPVGKGDARRRGLDDVQAFGLFGVIFFQRKMYWPKSVVGLCELEPKERRCPRADRHAEQFRLLQEINNLRYIDPDERVEQPLDEEQRTLVIHHLATREKATFDQIRTKLGFLETVKFNLERGKRPSIKGMTIDWRIAKEMGKAWHAREESQKDEIVRLLANHERDDEELAARLIADYEFAEDEAEKLLGVDLPPGYVSLSLKAINRLLPHLQRGLVYQSQSDPEVSALHAAGYLRRDELQRRLFDELPDLSRMRPSECKLGEIPNPVVKRALVELRKVVNSIIREYGRPDAVHVEMARSVQMGPQRRKEYNARMREREARRRQAADEIRERGDAVRRDSILRVLLWEEQSHECVYCGKPLSQRQLFGGEVHIDHILPYSRCLDDSQLNKVVCHRDCNGDKGQQTPHEWLAAVSPEKYGRVCLHVGSLMRKGLMPYGKYKRFLQKQLELDQFIARQLSDTGYITRATVEYLQLVFEKSHDVLGLKGQLTAELRWQWGLNTILAELPDSPAWQEEGSLRPGEKNRADHRHHAIDALVVALTNRRRLQQLSASAKRGGVRTHGEILPEPCQDFRDDVVRRVRELCPSYRVDHKVRGALHEETHYSATAERTEWVLRKPLVELSFTEIERIRDDGIKRIILDRLTGEGIEIGCDKKPDPKKLRRALADVKMPSGVPVKKVRLTKKDATIARLRSSFEDATFVKPGEIHHACLFLMPGSDDQVDGVYVSLLEASRRKKEKLVVVQRTHPEEPNARFIMSLHRGDLVLIAENGHERIMRVSTLVSTDKRVELVDAYDARRSGTRKSVRRTVTSLLINYRARKVTVDPIGRIRWAGD